jgi:hypothetical protein
MGGGHAEAIRALGVTLLVVSGLTLGGASGVAPIAGPSPAPGVAAGHADVLGQPTTTTTAPMEPSGGGLARGTGVEIGVLVLYLLGGLLLVLVVAMLLLGAVLLGVTVVRALWRRASS